MRLSVILLILLLHQSSEFLQSNYKKMMEKAKNYYKKMYKDKTSNFIGSDNSEYPGTNPKKLAINKKIWEDYYSCLKVQDSITKKYNSMNPDAILGFEGSFIRFDCKICLSPEEVKRIESIEWYWGPLGSKTVSLVEYTEHIMLSPEDKTLSLYNLQDSQTGQYLCKLGEALTTPYYLTVISSHSSISQVHSDLATYGPYPQKEEYISHYDLLLNTVWGEWSRCSNCDKVGKRHKLGYCTIYKKNYSAPINLKRHRKMESKQSNKLVVTYEDIEFVKVFDNGIPCLSHILPESIKQLPEVQSRPGEIMIGYCKEECKKDVIFEVKDVHGNIIERANNSAGIYSMLQSIPTVAPVVARELQYKRTEETIILTCPGNLNTDTPIQWQINSKTVIPELIAEQSGRRITVTVMEKINIKNAKISDSNIYSCWQNNELAGTIRLIVEKRVKMNFNHHIMLFGMVIILSVFVYVFAKAFLGRQYAKV